MNITALAESLTLDEPLYRARVIVRLDRVVDLLTAQRMLPTDDPKAWKTVNDAVEDGTLKRAPVLFVGAKWRLRVADGFHRLFALHRHGATTCAAYTDYRGRADLAALGLLTEQVAPAPYRLVRRAA